MADEPAAGPWDGSERRAGEPNEEKRVRALVRSEVDAALDGFLAKLDLAGSDEDSEDEDEDEIEDERGSKPTASQRPANGRAKPAGKARPKASPPADAPSGGSFLEFFLGKSAPKA
jgi:hypothetical protein